MKFKKIIAIALLFFVIFTISSVSANENVTDAISTEATPDETIELESDSVGNDANEEYNLIGHSKEDLLSKGYVINVIGPTSIERGEVAKFTIRDCEYGIGGSSDGINVTLIDFKGETCFSYPNLNFIKEVKELSIPTSNLIAGTYILNLTAANPNDSIENNPNHYLEITDSKLYGSYSPNNVKKFASRYSFEYVENKNVTVTAELQDSNNNAIYGYVDVFIDGAYYKRMEIKHAKETLNLGKLKIGKHTIKIQVRNGLYQEYEISVIKYSPPKGLIASAPAVAAYYKASKYFKVTVKKNGKAVKNLKITLRVYTGKKIKTYTIRTNSYGVAYYKTNKLTLGTHKVVVISTNKNYKFTRSSKIVIKKKSSYQIIYTTAKSYLIKKQSGNFAVETIIYDMTAGPRAPYKYIDTTLFRNGKQVQNSKYLVNYKINGKWTGWVKYGTDTTAHHRYLVPDSAIVGEIAVKFNKNVN